VTLVVATTNPGKLREIGPVLETLPIRLLTLRDFPSIPEPDETGKSFAENARIKALHYARATGVSSVAEDSGLEIAALDNAPGVHSARWHGTDYTVKFRKIYELLAARGVRSSAARFVCHVSLARDARILFEATGTVEGEIAPEPRGTNGFGYDPIFFYPPFACTLAELDPARKAAISHRGKAFTALRDFLRATADDPRL
jgi:XTP/dITP diphosphohydrolase